MSLERVFTWQRCCWLLLAIVVVQFMFTHGLPKGHTFGTSLATTKCAATTEYEDTKASQVAPAIRIDLHDEINEDLTSAQCQELFPRLYHDIERAVGHWRARGHTLTKSDIDIAWRSELEWPSVGGALRILIHDNELRITETRMVFGHPGYRGRAVGLLSLLNQAVLDATSSGEKLPTIEAAVVFEDSVEYPTHDGTHSVWTWTANVTNPSHDRHWLIPNFDFFSAGSIGSYRQTRRRAVAQDAPWTSKIPKLVWRGTVWYNPLIRGGLVAASKDKFWSDVQPLDWSTKDTYMTVDEMCNYAMTQHTEGGSYSGRLKFLLNCDSLTFIHDLEWRVYFSHLLEFDGPNQNYVKVRRDYADLDEKVRFYLANPAEAERVVQNSLATFRNKYIVPAAQSCYLRKLIHGFSSVSETPPVFRPGTEEKKVPLRRGKPFEEWVASTEDYLEDEI